VEGKALSVSAVAAGVAAQTSYPVVINGYVCFSAADVEAARKFTNPRSADEAEGTSSVSSKNKAGPSGQSSRAVLGLNADEETRDVNRPFETGTRGTVINILV